jgi:hypothetical protein
MLMMSYTGDMLTLSDGTAVNLENRPNACGR